MPIHCSNCSSAGVAHVTLGNFQGKILRTWGPSCFFPQIPPIWGLWATSSNRQAGFTKKLFANPSSYYSLRDSSISQDMRVEVRKSDCTRKASGWRRWQTQVQRNHLPQRSGFFYTKRGRGKVWVPARPRKGCVNFLPPAAIHGWTWSGCLL